MTIDGIVVAVLDLDSPAKSRFSPSDVASLERLAAVYVETLRASGPQA
jgi:putative methionine-R-sulfoxide reductase with GAF domain